METESNRVALSRSDPKEKDRQCLLIQMRKQGTDTNRVFDSYDKFKGDIKGRRNGVLIATDKGEAVAFALFNLQSRGSMFVEPKTKVYKGMIVGEHNRDNDLEVNVLKGKKLTNVRASGTDQAVILTPPRKMTLEQMMAYMADDELLEVTPKSLRLRKKILLSHLRKRAS